VPGIQTAKAQPSEMYIFEGFFMPMEFYVYIVKSQADSSYYIGYSANLDDRLRKHNEANTGYTSRKRPWALVYWEQYESKREAMKRERFLKNQKSREFIERLIEENK
jgi:putative endonuclease